MEPSSKSSLDTGLLKARITLKIRLISLIFLTIAPLLVFSIVKLANTPPLALSRESTRFEPSSPVIKFFLRTSDSATVTLNRTSKFPDALAFVQNEGVVLSVQWQVTQELLMLVLLVSTGGCAAWLLVARPLLKNAENTTRAHQPLQNDAPNLPLTSQETFFGELTDQAPQVMWTTCPQGQVTYVNHAWLHLLGGKATDWQGAQWLAVIHPEDWGDFTEKWHIARVNQVPFEGVRRLLAKDGSCRTMSYRAAPVFDSRGQVACWVGIDTDITQIKAIEATLRFSNQELESFSSSVSHDLRVPLSTIDGFSRLLAMELSSKAHEKGRHYVSRIQVGVMQMSQLIEDLLSLAQVSNLQLRYEAIDLSALAHDILAQSHTRAPEREVTICVEENLQVQGDVRFVRVALENLLSNAWKFSSQQTQAHIHVGQQTDAAGAPVFFVRDNGVGFDMANADKIFHAFQRLHTTSAFAGTGIGLATASRVIARHAGSLWAESMPGQGSTFFFTLPAPLISCSLTGITPKM